MHVKKYSEIKHDSSALESLRQARCTSLFRENRVLFPHSAGSPSRLVEISKDKTRIEAKLRCYKIALFRSKLKSMMTKRIEDYTGWEENAAKEFADQLVTRKYAAKLLEMYGDEDPHFSAMPPKELFEKLYGTAFAVAETLMVHFRAVHPKE